MPLLKIADAAPGLLDARADFHRPEDPQAAGFGDVVAAAFRRENLIGSTLASVSSTLDVHNDVDPAYSTWDDIKGTKYEQHWQSFVDSNNAAYTNALKARIDREEQDKATLDGAGGLGTLASIGAGLVDPTILIPGGGVVKSAEGGYSLLRSAGKVALDAALGAAVSEAGLQATQETRSGGESAVNIGSGLLFGGLLGGASAKLLSKAERKSVEKAYDTLNSMMSAPQSAGAAAVDLAGRADLTPSSAAGFGDAAAKLAEATQFSPNLRLQQSPSAAARRTGQGLAENTLYQTMHDEGRTMGAAVETLAKVEYQRRMASAVQVHDALFADMKKAGTAMSRPEFEEAVGRAMRNGDQALDGNEYVTKAAQAWRERLFDPFKDEAVRLGQLPPDVSVDTAASYFTRVWNKEQLTAREFDFKQRVADYFRAHIDDTYRASVENRSKRIAALDQELADLKLAPDERVATLARLEEEGKALDAIHPDEVDRVSRISDLRAQAKAAKAAGDVAGQKALKAEIARLTTEGGHGFKTYLDARRGLRRRQRSVDLNYAGMMDRADQIMDSLVELEEANFRSLNRLVERGRRVQLEVSRLDPAGQAKKISGLRSLFMDAAEKADKALERTRKQLDALGEDSPELAAKLTAAAKDQAARAERLTSLSRRLEAAEALDPEAALAEIREATDALVYEVSHLSLGRGEKAQRLKDRLARLDTKQIDERVKAVEALKNKIERDFYDRWEVKHGADLSKATPDFSQAGRDIADDVFDKLTGRAGEGSSLPEYLTPITRGPLKDRTFNVPDSLVEDFLDSNVMSVAERYGRTMAAETELTRRFGRADMRDQLIELKDDYRGLREAVEAADSVAAAREVAGAPNGLKDKEAILDFLRKRETADQRDLEALRDLVRGTYKAKENASNFGRVTRSLMAFNYVRQMGGALVANFAELYRPAMVHGLGRYMSEGVAPLLTNLKGVKASVKEAQLLGQVTERVLQHRLMTMGEIGDPYRAGSPIERFLQNATKVGSKLNGLVYWTDAQKAISSILSQNRILDGALKNGDTRFLAYLGIDGDMAERIAKAFKEHGETVDGVKVANTEAWDDAAAVRAYRAAVSKDVDSIIVTKSVGDAPLFVNTPAGKMLAQFKNYMFASHQRVLLRGLQESKARFVSGMVATTALGMLAATARSWRGGDDRFEKFKEASDNPGYLIAEGLDNSGLFALPFEAANTAEKLTGGFNPLKTPTKALGLLAPGDQSMQGDSTRFASRDPVGALLGPTAGLVSQTAKASAGALNAAKEGRAMSEAEARAATGLLPGSTYIGMREMLQALMGDSPYVPE